MTAPVSKVTPFDYCQGVRPHPSIEIDLESYIDMVYAKEEARKRMEAQERWIKEYRSKMFKNVLGDPNGRRASGQANKKN